MPDLIITPPTADGNPTPTVTFEVTRDGFDVLGEVSNGRITNAPIGDYSASWTAANGVSPNATVTRTASVEAPDVPSVDYFTTQRSTIPWYSSATGPTAAYDQASNTTFICWQAHDAALDDRVTRATSYNHGTATWGDTVLIGRGNVQDDDHGVPALCILADGRIAIFWGSHNAPMDYAISSSPRSLAGFTNYRLTGVEYTYWRPIARPDGGIDLFCRSRISGQSKMTLVYRRITMAGGVPTMGAENTVVDFGTDSRFYSGDTFRGDDGYLWMIATKANIADSERKNNYLLRIDPANQRALTLSGAASAWPITDATAFLTYTHAASSSVTGGIPGMARDAAGRIHVTFMTGAAAGSGGTQNTSPQDLMHQIIVGTTIGTPFKIGDMDQRYESSRCIPLSGGRLGVYFPSTQGVRGGDIVRRVFDAGATTPGPLETLLTYDPARDPAGEIQFVQNAHPNFRVAFAEASADDDDGSARDHRMWAHGDKGFVKRAITAPGRVGTLSAAGGGDSRTISWLAPASGGSDITDYVITLDGQVVADGVSNATSYTLTGLADGTRAVTVAAVNAYGTGQASPELTFTVDTSVTAPARAYRMDEGSGGTITSGDGIVATINGATWSATPTRLIFDGVNDQVNVPAPAQHGTDYVYAALVRLSNVTGDRSLISRYGTENITQRGGQLRVSNGRLDWVAHRANNTAGTVISAPAGTVPVNTWQILSAYVQGTVVSLAINGQVVTTGTYPDENRSSDLAGVGIRIGAAMNSSNGTIRDWTAGDFAAASIVYGATSDTMAEVVTELQSIAASKGITF